MGSQCTLSMILNRNTGYMKSLVIKTIELAKLNSPKTVFSLKDTNLFDEVNAVLKNNKLMFQDHNIALHNNINEKILVKADKLHLEELLNNLITNSIKYSISLGKVVIDAIPEGAFIKASVRDTGIGMTEEQLKRVFDEFYKADPARHDFESSGLGMPICKRIVEKHGGHIWCESPGLGKGSTFYFTLPRGSSS